MKLIPLTRGASAMVDDCDFPLLSQWKWYAGSNKGRLYAKRDEFSSGKRRCVYMHRFITSAPNGFHVDHIDHNTLNNQRTNIRVATPSQNGANRGLQRNNRSGFKHVNWSGADKRWAAYIKVNGKTQFLGNFLCPKDAALAYDLAAIKTFGEFAVTNRSLGLL